VTPNPTVQIGDEMRQVPDIVHDRSEHGGIISFPLANKLTQQQTSNRLPKSAWVRPLTDGRSHVKWEGALGPKWRDAMIQQD